MVDCVRVTKDCLTAPPAGHALPPAPQGANSFGLTAANVGAIFTDASNLAAFDSLVLGELPAMERSEVEVRHTALLC